MTATPLTAMRLHECPKIGYKEGVAAFKHLRQIQAVSTSGKVPTHLYACDRCNRYHLTSSTKEESRVRLRQLPMLSMAQNPNLHEYRMLQIAFIGTYEELAALVANPSITPTVELMLSINDDVEVRKLLAARHDVDIETQRVLAVDTAAVKTVLVKNPTVAAETLDLLRPAATNPNKLKALDEALALTGSAAGLPTSEQHTALPILSFLAENHQQGVIDNELHTLMLYLVGKGWVKKRAWVYCSITMLRTELDMNRHTLNTNIGRIAMTGLWTTKVVVKNNQDYLIMAPEFLDRIKK